MKGEIIELKLVVGRDYVNQRGEIISIKKHYLGTFEGYNSTTRESHWYLPDGCIVRKHLLSNADIICELKSAPLHYYPTSKGNKTFAEKLRAISCNVNNAGELQQIKNVALAAAKCGALKVEVRDSLHYDLELQALLREEGLHVFSEYAIFQPTQQRVLTKVYVSWGEVEES